ncbi:MAG: cardiolipin synthase [Clostridia bacterium]|nr:cardiolipin synthase [Clostridia bacterium]NLS85670.1 cardiolipin synthase [Oscillospiraceae bacterium]
MWASTPTNVPNRKFVRNCGRIWNPSLQFTSNSRRIVGASFARPLRFPQSSPPPILTKKELFITKKSTLSVPVHIFEIAVSILIQIGVYVIVFKFFRNYFSHFYVVCAVLSLLVAIHIVKNDNINPAVKIAWIIPLFILPIFGGLIYLIFGEVRHSKREKRINERIHEKFMRAIAVRPTADAALKSLDPAAAVQSQYIKNAAGMPVYASTSVKYYAFGEEMFADMCAELEKAQSFIFMEYFIIQSGKMWDTLLEILARKAREGVDVRFMYDDVGSLFLVPGKYSEKLKTLGIKCIAFNKLTNIFSSRFNNRDHRKICVIDGNVGFTGGINLADEYINERRPHGVWKDTAVMLKGDGVWGLTIMFLTLWEASLCPNRRKEPFYMPDEDYLKFAPTEQFAAEGFVQTYTDTPLDHEPVGETVYMNMLYRAKEHVYITTPYLIIDNEMLTALKTAAKSGIDVRMILPGIPDKKLIFFLTRSYYKTLLEAGVKIYEYTPGFVHAKSFTADGKYAVVGTINLDYRSLYLHYECAAWMYASPTVTDVENDFLATQNECTEITLETFNRYTPLIQQVFLGILRIFAPLM